MAQLGCTAKNCVYNKSEFCCKGNIMVGGNGAAKKEDTCCESFSNRSGDSFTSGIMSHPGKTISIDCDALTCKYNSNYKCYADHVDIKGSNAEHSRDTACATFIEK